MVARFKFDVFLSHNKVDKAWTEHLARQIEGDMSGPPLRVFFDAWDVAPGTAIPNGLAEAIDTSRRIAFVLSPAALNSDWVQMEMNIAVARRDPAGNKGALLPLLRRTCAIPAVISHLSYIDLRPRVYHDGLSRLIDVLRDRAPNRGPGSAEDVRQFAEDCELIAEQRTFFERPAFSRPCALELSLSDLAQAIDDTVEALNTGKLHSRKGRLLATTRPRGKYQTDRFVAGILRVSEGLMALQRFVRDCQLWFKHAAPHYTGHDDCSSMLYATQKGIAASLLERMDAIDRTRNEIIDALNELLRLAGERPLPTITLSSDLGARHG